LPRARGAPAERPPRARRAPAAIVNAFLRGRPPRASYAPAARAIREWGFTPDFTPHRDFKI